VVAAVFGLWDDVIPRERRFSQSRQLTLLPKGGPKKVETQSVVEAKEKAADKKG
jgi:hypothetical protein